MTWGDPIQIKLWLENTPFAVGGMRKAYRGRILPGHGGKIFSDDLQVVVKEFQDAVAAAWAVRYQGDLLLTKSKLLEKVGLPLFMFETYQGILTTFHVLSLHYVLSHLS